MKTAKVAISDSLEGLLGRPKLTGQYFKINLEASVYNKNFTSTKLLDVLSKH